MFLCTRVVYYYRVLNTSSEILQGSEHNYCAVIKGIMYNCSAMLDVTVNNISAYCMVSSTTVV